MSLRILAPRVFAAVVGSILISASVAAARSSHQENRAARCTHPQRLPHPGLFEISSRLYSKVWSEDRNTHFVALRNPYTVRDGHGGALTAVVGFLCCGDGTAQDIFFWHDRAFIGLASRRILDPVATIMSPRLGVLLVRFAHYAANDPRCCPSLRPIPVVYRWTGTHLVRSGTAPAGPTRAVSYP